MNSHESKEVELNNLNQVVIPAGFAITQDAIFANPNKLVDWLPKLSELEVTLLCTQPNSKKKFFIDIIAELTPEYLPTLIKLFDKLMPLTVNEILAKLDLSKQKYTLIALLLLVKANDIKLINQLILTPVNKVPFIYSLLDITSHPYTDELESTLLELKQQLLQKIKTSVLNGLIITYANPKELKINLLFSLINKRQIKLALAIVEKCSAEALHISLLQKCEDGSCKSVLQKCFSHPFTSWKDTSQGNLDFYEMITNKTKVSIGELITVFTDEIVNNRNALLFASVGAYYAPENRRERIKVIYTKILFALNKEQMKKELTTFSDEGPDGKMNFLTFADLATVEKVFEMVGVDIFRLGMTPHFINSLVKPSSSSHKSNIAWLYQIKNPKLLDSLLTSICEFRPAGNIFKAMEEYTNEKRNKLDLTKESFFVFFKHYPNEFADFLKVPLYIIKDEDQFVLSIINHSISDLLKDQQIAATFYHYQAWKNILNYLEKNLHDNKGDFYKLKFKICMQNGDLEETLKVVDSLDPICLTIQEQFNILMVYYTKICNFIASNDNNSKEPVFGMYLDKLYKCAENIIHNNTLEEKSELPIQDKTKLIVNELKAKYKCNYKENILNQLSILVLEHKSIIDNSVFSRFMKPSVTPEQYKNESTLTTNFKFNEDIDQLHKDASSMNVSKSFKELVTKITNLGLRNQPTSAVSMELGSKCRV